MRRLLPLILLLALAMPAGAQFAVNRNDPTDYPFGPVMITRTNRTAAAGSYITIDSSATGTSGVIRAISMRSTTGFAQTDSLLMYEDGHAAADVACPINALVGMDSTAFRDSTSLLDTRFFCNTVPSSGNPQAVLFKWPMAFTNGYKIRVSSVTGNTIWAEVTRQKSLPACPNRNLQFRIALADSLIHLPWIPPYKHGTSPIRKMSITTAGVGTAINCRLLPSDAGRYIAGPTNSWSKELQIASVGDSTTSDTIHFTIAPTDRDALIQSAYVNSGKYTIPHITLLRPAGERGWIVSVFASLAPDSGAASTNMLEACPRLWMNATHGATGLSPDVIASGGEDFFGGVGYGFGKPGWLMGATAGDSTMVPGDTTWTPEWTTLNAYRHFADAPLRYTNGASATWTNEGAARMWSRWRWIYYKER